MYQSPSRRTLSALLIVLSITVASRSPTHGADSAKPQPERPSYDLTYVPPGAMGVVAIRPHAICCDPAMKPLAGMVNEGLAQLRQAFQLSAEPKLSIEDIDEIVGFITITVGDKSKGGKHTLRAGLTLIRASHDFDWLKLMRQLDPKTEEIHNEGRVYYRSHYPQLLGGAASKAFFCFVMPDKRTIAFLQGKSLTVFLNGPGVQRPHFAWEKDWKRIEHGLIAVALDNRWARGLSKEQIGGEDSWASLARHAATMTAGVDWKDGIDFRALLSCKDRKAGDQIVKDIKAMLAQLRSDAEQAPKDVPENERQAVAFYAQMYKALAEHARIQQRGAAVRVHTTAKVNLADCAKCLFSECGAH